MILKGFSPFHYTLKKKKKGYEHVMTIGHFFLFVSTMISNLAVFFRSSVFENEEIRNILIHSLIYMINE